MKYDLTNPKTGSLTTDLRALVGDLPLILKNKELRSWAEDYRTISDLQLLVAVAENYLAFYKLPFYRLASTTVEGIRKYYLKTEDYARFSTEDLKSAGFMFGLFTKGLKQNEKRFILEYVQKIGYVLPLQKGKKYTWIQVKKLLKQQMNEPNISKTEEAQHKEKRLEYIRTAWNMIHEKLSNEEIGEIIMKTGFGIQLLWYHSPLQQDETEFKTF